MRPRGALLDGPRLADEETGIFRMDEGVGRPVVPIRRTRKRGTGKPTVHTYPFEAT